MLTVVCWKWTPAPGYRSQFGPQTVNVLRSMVRRNYRKPHEFVCVTDDAKGIDPAIRIVPLWNDHSGVPSPHGKGNPSCYRRLKAFSPEAASIIGPRFVSLDLDCVITGDMVPVWDIKDDFCIWGDTSPNTPYNGSMFLLTAGSRRQVWEQFDPVNSPRLAIQKGYFGSDQAWIGACLGEHERKWTKADGVYSYRNDVRIKGGYLPAAARIVFFHGQFDPWQPEIQRRHPWVRNNWC